MIVYGDHTIVTDPILLRITCIYNDCISYAPKVSFPLYHSVSVKQLKK